MTEEDNEEYICLINEEKQYSIWFAWEVWADMRPKKYSGADEYSKLN